jgi:hypothetical protein
VTGKFAESPILQTDESELVSLPRGAKREMC